MRKCILFLLIFCHFSLKSQVKMCIDSTLFETYKQKYGISEGLILMPFYCDPFCKVKYSKADTLGLCGKLVFVNENKQVKIKTDFELPCWFEPRFREGLCAVSIKNKLAVIDTLGNLKFSTDLLACSQQKNKISSFINGKAKVYKGHGSFKHYYEVFYIDKNGNKLSSSVAVKVRLKPRAIVVTDPAIDTVLFVGNQNNNENVPVFELPVLTKKGYYPLPPDEYNLLLSKNQHKDNRMLVYFNCGAYQLEHMSLEDTVYCGNFVFTDSFLNIKIGKGFKLPCGFEPEFSEGLCAVSIQNEIVYMDTFGQVKIHTGLKACDTILNKASTFRNGIATLYVGDKSTRGLFTTIAINTSGERVRLLEFDDLELAELKYKLFKNLTEDEVANCFVGKGKTNGIWFLIEKTGKIRKKLELK